MPNENQTNRLSGNKSWRGNCVESSMDRLSDPRRRDLQMVDTTIYQELSTYLGQMPVERQRQVLDFARNLATPQIQGVRGTALLRFAGAIDESDLDAMSKAIEDGCERIDSDEW